MNATSAFASHCRRLPCAIGVLAASILVAAAADWPQYRGPAGDGNSTDRIQKSWAPTGPTVAWRKALTNGFSSFTISQGRAYTLISRNSGGLKEMCVALDAATGTQLWATPLDSATSWDYTSTSNGGEGTSPYHRGDGPRSTPSVKDGRVFALSGHLHLLCLNATNGSVLWSNNLATAYGAAEPVNGWQSAASPRLDDDLLFVNLGDSTLAGTLAAFRITNGAVVWSSRTEGSTHSTPTVATIEGVRQVIFATDTGVVSVDRSTGAFLWKHTYPFFPVDTALGASPVVWSNIVVQSAAYGSRGTVAIRVTKSGSTWSTSQAWYQSSIKSTWMTPVVYNGYLYGKFSDKAYYSTPLKCLDMANGTTKWSTNNFGMSGIIQVDNALMTLTDDGRFILFRPNPTNYTELARYQAFSFSTSARGKCWSTPSVADGRVYLRSTLEGLAIDLSVSPLKMLPPQRVAGNRLQLWVGTDNGSAIDTNRLTKMEVRYATNASVNLVSWLKLTNNLVLTNGQVRVDNVNSGPTRYFIATEQP
jgi:outer membrane protein assembly factor BamB